MISYRAIKRFNIAIRMDPTYIRAYMCRADAYERIHDVSNYFYYFLLLFLLLIAVQNWLSILTRILFPTALCKNKVLLLESQTRFIFNVR